MHLIQAHMHKPMHVCFICMCFHICTHVWLQRPGAGPSEVKGERVMLGPPRAVPKLLKFRFFSSLVGVDGQWSSLATPIPTGLQGCNLVPQVAETHSPDNQRSPLQERGTRLPMGTQDGSRQ